MTSCSIASKHSGSARRSCSISQTPESGSCAARRRGDFIFRYVEADEFGKPDNAFLVCTFWYINALAALGRREEARGLFENVLACRNRHGLLAEHIDPRTREQWGNFVQTYSMVGLIGSAIRLSVRWDQAF